MVIALPLIKVYLLPTMQAASSSRLRPLLHIESVILIRLRRSKILLLRSLMHNAKLCVVF
jgi:hypothetical protein